MELVTQVQIRDKTVCTSFHANALDKGMNPFVLSLPHPITGK